MGILCIAICNLEHKILGAGCATSGDVVLSHPKICISTKMWSDRYGGGLSWLARSAGLAAMQAPLLVQLQSPVPAESRTVVRAGAPSPCQPVCAGCRAPGCRLHHTLTPELPVTLAWRLSSTSQNFNHGEFSSVHQI